MPNGSPIAAPKANSVHYVVSTGDRVESGTAEDLLRIIQSQANDGSSVHRMDLNEYTRVLVSDAVYFMPGATFEYLRQEKYPTQYDRALMYLANMESSRVRILSKET